MDLTSLATCRLSDDTVTFFVVDVLLKCYYQEGQSDTQNPPDNTDSDADELNHGGFLHDDDVDGDDDDCSQPHPPNPPER